MCSVGTIHVWHVRCRNQHACDIPSQSQSTRTVVYLCTVAGGPFYRYCWGGSAVHPGVTVPKGKLNLLGRPARTLVLVPRRQAGDHRSPNWAGTWRATMPRHLIPFSTGDISSLAKSLRRQLADSTTLPSHLELLNMLARAAGQRNFQHLRSQTEPRPASLGPNVEPASASPEAPASVVKAARFFDEKGRLTAWPARTSLQNLCLWVLWSAIPADHTFTERKISDHLNMLHTFGDAAILRRTLCNLGRMKRTKDGRVYHRCEVVPSPEGAAFIKLMADGPTLRRPGAEMQRTPASASR